MVGITHLKQIKLYETEMDHVLPCKLQSRKFLAKKGDIISSGNYFTKEYVMILSVCTLDSVKLYEAKTEKKNKSSISVRNFNINPSANELSKLKPAYM